jgi:hypothetical protein
MCLSRGKQAADVAAQHGRIAVGQKHVDFSTVTYSPTRFW